MTALFVENKNKYMHMMLCTILISLCLLTGCSDATVEENAELIDPNTSSMKLLVDETIDDRYKVQIPIFESTIGSEVIDDINRDIDMLLVSMYERDMEDEDKTSDIRTIIDDSSKYLQAVVMYVEYPLLGSDGDVVSYNYVRDEDKRLTLSDALIIAETTLDDLKNEIVEVYYAMNQDSADELSIYGMTVDGFIINEAEAIDFYGNIDISVNASEPWSYIFRYSCDEGYMELLEK